MRLDNNRGFFSPEQKSCRILINLTNMFCINEDMCYVNRQGSKAMLGDKEREDSFLWLACGAFPDSSDQIPASISHPCVKCCWVFVDGKVPPRSTLTRRPVPAY